MTNDLLDVSIQRIQEASRMSEKLYGKPLLLTYSGGKDSAVCLRLMQMSGVPFEVMHNHTTADAPSTSYGSSSDSWRLRDSTAAFTSPCSRNSGLPCGSSSL